MTNITDPVPFDPLSPAVFHILMSLADAPRHGYAIMKDVEAQTDGALVLGPGTLYGCIKRMLDAKLIAPAAGNPRNEEDERRRYYRLTDTGRRVARAEASRLARAVKTAQSRRLLPVLGLAPIGGA